MKPFHIARCVLGLLVVGASVTTTGRAAEAPDPLWWSLRPLRMPQVPGPGKGLDEERSRAASRPYPGLPSDKGRRGGDTAPYPLYRWIKTPIDAFILAKLEENKLAPAAPADKRTLLRRVCFDLTGLPPTPEQMRAFLDDPSPDAYEKVVDQLLSSPRYGERWARHWLDIVHYAETHGHDQDRPRTNSWPYRDYVVRSFSEGKPYARFVQEQIAGDVSFPDDPQGIVAMGFLATGPWDESSLRDIREDSIDRQIARYLDRDDIVMTTMNTFVSTTVQCARCHDHKFDPISQAEYYGLQAVFAATDKADRSYDVDPGTHARRRQLVELKKGIERKDPELLGSMREPGFVRELAEFEAHRAAIQWTVLQPITLSSSSNGSTLTVQQDLSILASGNLPETDVYTVAAGLPKSGDPALAGPHSKEVTAIRLEVLTDDSLPQKGPGRVADNGNFHLTDFRLKTVSNGKTNTIALENAAADFNQKDWEITKAVDNDPKSAWGIYPEGGKAHYAFFELKEPRRYSGEPVTFILEQNHGRKHVIGRFRLSATITAKPISACLTPEPISKILALSAAERTTEQMAELGWYFLKHKIDAQIAALPPPKLIYAGANDFVPDGSFKPAKGPRAVHVLKRGDINRPGEAAVPGAFACVAQLQSRFQLSDDKDEASRRKALAEWITDSRNPLTWRSIANRIWHHHFGRGLVETPNDFGHMGALPSHPELLDWLACTLRDNGGSIKQLHRIIVTSAVYRQSCAHNPAFARVDSANRYLWRMNRTRLDAESLRDAILQITGTLDLTMGGPSAQQFVMTAGIHATPNVDYAKFDIDSRASCRRSIYRFIFRTLPDPFMDSLDCPDSSQLTPVRNVSMTALQALALWNNHFIIRQSQHFAERLASGKTVEDQIAAAYQLALGRPPRKNELKDLAAYARKHGLANACRVILNCNEFIFLN